MVHDAEQITNEVITVVHDAVPSNVSTSVEKADDEELNVPDAPGVDDDFDPDNISEADQYQRHSWQRPQSQQPKLPRARSVFSVNHESDL